MLSTPGFWAPGKVDTAFHRKILRFLGRGGFFTVAKYTRKSGKERPQVLWEFLCMGRADTLSLRIWGFSLYLVCPWEEVCVLCVMSQQWAWAQEWGGPEIFLFQTFRVSAGYPGKIPKISRQEVCFPWVSKDMPNFLTPPMSQWPIAWHGRPPPHRKISRSTSLPLCSLFLPDLLLCHSHERRNHKSLEMASLGHSAFPKI